MANVYTRLHYVISPQQEDSVVTQLSVHDFNAYVIASRTDAMLDLELFSQDAGEINRLKAICENIGLVCSAETQYNEADMLAQYNPQAPIQLHERLLIDPQNKDADFAGICLHIPAGPAFGDGRHPTTQMLARYLMEADVSARRCLDLGCGTGLLGLVAWKRGAALVDFTDVDADALDFTRELCALNGYADAKVWESNLLEACTGSYDVLIANIYADLLLDVLDDPQLQTVLPQGTALLSGISYKRIDEVLTAAGRAGFDVLEQQEQSWWHSLVLQR